MVRNSLYSQAAVEVEIAFTHLFVFILLGKLIEEV